MPDTDKVTVIPYDPRIGGAEPERRREHVPRDDAKRLSWLTWRSNGCEHGLKPHKVGQDGAIQETGDCQAATRKKPKSVSSRQWGRA